MDHLDPWSVIRFWILVKKRSICFRIWVSVKKRTIDVDVQGDDDDDHDDDDDDDDDDHDDNDDKYIDLATAKNEALLVKEGLFFYPT